MNPRKALINFAKSLESGWHSVDIDAAGASVAQGWYISEFLIQGSIQTTPRIIVRDNRGVDTERFLTGSHSGSNRMLFFLPEGRLEAYSKSIKINRLACISNVEGRARVLLICFRYLIDFFGLKVLFKIIAMQFQNNQALCDELLHLYEPPNESYLQNIHAWKRYRGYGRQLGWLHRKTKIAVLIENEAQRPALNDLLVPPEYILLAEQTQLLPADVDYVIALSATEKLRFPALLMLKRAIKKAGNRARLIYTDHDYSPPESERQAALEPAFKPDPSLVYLYSFNYIGPALMFARNVVHEIPPTDLLSDKVRYQVALSCMADVSRVLHVDEALFVSERQKPPRTPRPFKQALPWPDIRWQRQGTYNVLRATQKWTVQPSVDLIVPTRDGLAVLEPCIESILKLTEYQNYKIYIVDNGSEKDETIQFLNRIAEDPRVEVSHFPGEFNFSAINNFAAKQGSGDFIGLINNDIEVIHGDWLRQMLVWAKQSTVGVVGAKLLFSDGKVQHAGVTIGMGNAAGHIHRLENGDAPGYQHRCLATQNMMAVTAACMITPRSLYQRLDGLNAKKFAVAYNDIDYCLRVEALGLEIIWTPEARLYHHESVSRGDDMSQQHIGRYFSELSALQKRWKTKGFVDKYYSRHLRISDEGVYPQIAREQADELVCLKG